MNKIECWLEYGFNLKLDIWYILNGYWSHFSFSTIFAHKKKLIWKGFLCQFFLIYSLTNVLIYLAIKKQLTPFKCIRCFVVVVAIYINIKSSTSSSSISLHRNTQNCFNHLKLIICHSSWALHWIQDSNLHSYNKY